MKTIFIIDDELTMRMLSSKIFELESYEVYQTKD